VVSTLLVLLLLLGCTPYVASPRDPNVCYGMVDECIEQEIEKMLNQLDGQGLWIEPEKTIHKLPTGELNGRSDNPN
jgi:hypothetical protein